MSFWDVCTDTGQTIQFQRSWWEQCGIDLFYKLHKLQDVLNIINIPKASSTEYIIVRMEWFISTQVLLAYTLGISIREVYVSSQTYAQFASNIITGPHSLMFCYFPTKCTFMNQTLHFVPSTGKPWWISFFLKLDVQGNQSLARVISQIIIYQGTYP